MAMIPHYLLINDQLLGVLKGNEAHVNLPPGRYKVTIRSMYKFIESSFDVWIIRKHYFAIKVEQP